MACAFMLALVVGTAYRMLLPSSAVSYATMPVTTGSVTRIVTATGSVNPVLTIIVGSYVSGVIRELHCDFNTRVEKGQVCAKIDPRPHQAAVDDANVSESDISSIREGNKASFSVESFPDRTFAAMVVQVRQAPQTVQNVVTYDVVLGTDNTALLLKPGMTATVRIITDARAHVLRVPDQALRFVPGNLASPAPAEEGGAGRPQRVWKLANGHPVPVQVMLGLDDDSFTEVLGGDLMPGDAVIVGEQRSPARAAAGSPPRFSP